MSAPESDVRHKVQQRLAFADEDPGLVRHGLTMTIAVPPYRLIAYHALQCAEKCLKAYLVLRGMDFPYTHNRLRRGWGRRRLLGHAPAVADDTTLPRMDWLQDETIAVRCLDAGGGVG